MYSSDEYSKITRQARYLKILPGFEITNERASFSGNIFTYCNTFTKNTGNKIMQNVKCGDTEMFSFSQDYIGLIYHYPTG